MALTILNEQYPPRKPKLTLTADSLDELPTEGVAEESTATVGGTEYVYENNSGWIEPGSGGGGGGAVFWVTFTLDQERGVFLADKSYPLIIEAINSGRTVLSKAMQGDGTYDVLSLGYVDPTSVTFFSQVIPTNKTATEAYPYMLKLADETNAATPVGFSFSIKPGE